MNDEKKESKYLPILLKKSVYDEVEKIRKDEGVRSLAGTITLLIERYKITNNNDKNM
jgi:CTP:molybdopterin cytidylyltransferase MocA